VIYGAFQGEDAMRRILLVLLAAASLSGCAGLFDDTARRECDVNTRANERGACYDRIDQDRREREGRQ
jgi:uncharacterized protein YceK